MFSFFSNIFSIFFLNKTIYISDENGRGLLIDPDIVGYAYSVHEYRFMSPEDQIRLNTIRLEIDRIRIGMRRLNMLMHARSGFFESPTTDENTQSAANQTASEIISCSICFERFTTTTITIAPFCGHIYCRNCYNSCKSTQNRCGVCTQNFRSAANYFRLYFRFNFQNKIVCRQCMIEFNKESEVRASRCGCVFCLSCYEIMGSVCYGCNAEYARAHKVINIHLSFN